MIELYKNSCVTKTLTSYEKSSKVFLILTDMFNKARMLQMAQISVITFVCFLVRRGCPQLLFLKSFQKDIVIYKPFLYFKYTSHTPLFSTVFVYFSFTFFYDMRV